MFILDVLRAKHGDCMFLHSGTETEPQHILIDGGPATVYRKYLKPYLLQLAEDTHASPLAIRLLMISHIDDDHIRGILNMTRELRSLDDDGEPLPFQVQTLWHNSFDDLIGNQPDLLINTASTSVSTAGTRVETGANPKMTPAGNLLLASVPQGRQLRLDAEALGWEINEPGGGHIVASKQTPFLWTNESGDLTLQVIGPGLERIRELQEKWDKELERRGLGERIDPVETAAFVDRSVFNLASIVVLAQSGGRRMLLTGDARGDDILAGLEDAKLLDDGRIHVDLLKLPHHGSDRNVAPVFFEKITADRYVFSGDGRHGNPEPKTFEMLLAARAPGEHFNIYLTYALETLIQEYPVAQLQAIFRAARAAGKSFDIISLSENESVHRIDLSQ